jgi:hypothetical protein
MSNAIDLDEIERRAQRAFYENGLIDIVVGSVMLVLAFIFVASRILSVFFSIFVVFGFEAITEAIKERYIYPRMGYAEYPEPVVAPNPAVIVIILTSVIGMFALFFILTWVMGVTGWILWFVWIAPLTFGCIISLGLFTIAEKLQLKRYYLFGIIPILVGILTPFIFIIPEAGYSSLLNTVGLEMVLVGILSIASGLWLFTRFLKKYPVTNIDLEPSGDSK